jgi:hypothetical protein
VIWPAAPSSLVPPDFHLFALRSILPPMRRDRDDETRYGWPPLPPSYLLPVVVPWDDPIADHSPLWLEGKCACGRRLYPLRLLAAHVGWRRTLRDVVPRLRCQACEQRPSAWALIADAADGATGRIGGGGKGWRLVLEWN